MLSIQNISLYCIYTRILQVNYVTQSIRNANTLSWRIWNVRGCQGSLCVPDHFHGFLQKLSRPVQLLKRCKFRKWVECENMEIHGNTEYCTIIEHRNRRQLALLLNDDLLRIYIYIYIYMYIYIYISTKCPCFRVEALSGWWNKQGWFRLIIQYGFHAFVPRLPRCHHFSWKKKGGKP